MISINWPEIIRWLLLILGGGGTAALAVGWASSGAKPKPVTPKDPESTPVRSADAGPPDGAVEWVENIWLAHSGAAADSVIASLRAGDTRDKAQARRIAELEGPAA